MPRGLLIFPLFGVERSVGGVAVVVPGDAVAAGVEFFGTVEGATELRLADAAAERTSAREESLVVVGEAGVAPQELRAAIFPLSLAHFTAQVATHVVRGIHGCGGDVGSGEKEEIRGSRFAELASFPAQPVVVD